MWLVILIVIFIFFNRYWQRQKVILIYGSEQFTQQLIAVNTTSVDGICSASTYLDNWYEIGNYIMPHLNNIIKVDIRALATEELKQRLYLTQIPNDIYAVYRHMKYINTNGTCVEGGKLMFSKNKQPFSQLVTQFITTQPITYWLKKININYNALVIIWGYETYTADIHSAISSNTYVLPESKYNVMTIRAHEKYILPDLITDLVYIPKDMSRKRFYQYYPNFRGCY